MEVFSLMKYNIDVAATGSKKTPDRRAVMLSLCTWNKNNEALHHHDQYVNDLNQIRYMIWSYWNMFSEEENWC